MSSTGTAPQQSFDPRNHRACGAMCLAKVYRAYGKEIADAEIWPKVARQNRFGSIASTTHLMAQDALARGFHAVMIQARHPLETLRNCQSAGIRAILNHRLAPDSPVGHYSVLAAIDPESVTLDDPTLGRPRPLKNNELLELWQPRFPNAEIFGYMLIGITADPSPLDACWLCRTPIPADMRCPRCGKAVPLQPTSLLGCINTKCAARTWNYIGCPACDNAWGAAPSEPADAAKAAVEAAAAPVEVPAAAPLAPGIGSLPALSPSALLGGAADPWNLQQAFAELDRFRAKLMENPDIAKNLDVQKQFQIIEENKQKLVQQQAQFLDFRASSEAKIAEMKQAAEAKMQAHLERLAELKQPGGGPLDPQELSRALLKNLGLSQ